MIFIAVLNYTTSYITVDFILIIKSHRIRKAVFALQIKAISNRFQKIKYRFNIEVQSLPSAIGA